MKAAFYTGNKNFEIETVQPATPNSGEVKVTVAYCGVCGTDLHAYHGKMDARIGFHRIIGHEVSGVVSAVGDGIEDIAIGDPVVVRPLVSCGSCPACRAGHSHICHNLKFLGLDSDGALQQYWNVPAETIHKIPATMPLNYAALVEPTAVACHDVNRSRLVAGEDALVIGGGPIGMLIAMVARHVGANVTVSEVNEQRLEFARSRGFETINPAKESIGESIHAKTDGKGADVVFEVSGTQPGVDAMTETVATRGRIVMVAIHAEKPTVDLFKFFWREIEMLGARVYAAEDFERAIELIASGIIDCDAMITDVRDLEQVSEAFEALSGNPQAMKSLIKCT